MMDPSDVGGYTGLTRKIVTDENQKNALKKLLNEGGLIPGKSKLKLNGMGIKFDAKEIQLPLGWDVASKVETNFNGSGETNFNDGNSNSGNGNNDGPIRTRKLLRKVREIKGYF